MEALYKSSRLSETIPAESVSEHSTLCRGEIFRASRRRQIVVFTLTCSVQCLARENHT